MFIEKSVSPSLPKVSVCIMTYNQCHYIEATVRSVLAQCGEGRDFELEILIGDDHSTDGSSEVLAALQAQYPSKVVWIRQPSNLGGHRNMRSLLQRATGNYIAHLDGDDYWLPEKLMRQLRALEASPLSVACYTNALVVDEANRFVGLFTNRQAGRLTFAYLAERGNFLNFSSTLYRAQVKELILAQNQPMIDYEIHLLMANQADLCFLNEPLVCYRWMSATSTLRHHFEDFSILYAQALERRLIGTSASIRSQAVSLYILTTLMKRRDWLFHRGFWRRVGALTTSLRLARVGLIWPMLHIGCLGLRRCLLNALTRMLSRTETSNVMFPRL
ncbi:MAG: glycosyltransferase [Curvibacter sp.]|nr:MAG: glycosyltransferase [Curvibacter sp.]